MHPVCVCVSVAEGYWRFRRSDCNPHHGPIGLQPQRHVHSGKALRPPLGLEHAFDLHLQCRHHCVVILCAETERSQRFLRDESHQTRLAHQPPGLRRQIPHLDDVCLLFTSGLGLHPDLYGDSDHHVSSCQINVRSNKLLHSPYFCFLSV